MTQPAHNHPPLLRYQRDALILLANEYEIPASTIARALNLTETRVRQIIKAAEEPR